MRLTNDPSQICPPAGFFEPGAVLTWLKMAVIQSEGLAGGSFVATPGFDFDTGARHQETR